VDSRTQVSFDHLRILLHVLRQTLCDYLAVVQLPALNEALFSAADNALRINMTV
jgi:hypothetical protein